MELYDVVIKLIGRTDPVGESNEDGRRFENLESMIYLMDNLLLNMCELRKYKGRSEYSLNKAGMRACEYLQAVYITLKEYEDTQPAPQGKDEDEDKAGPFINKIEDTMHDHTVPIFFEKATGRKYSDRETCINDIRRMLMSFWNLKTLERQKGD